MKTKKFLLLSYCLNFKKVLTGQTLREWLTSLLRPKEMQPVPVLLPIPPKQLTGLNS